MPAIDVTELLTDPDFATIFDVERSTAAVGANGRNVLTPTVHAGIVGVVQPANSDDLQRLPDAEYQKGTITLYTTFRLTTGGSGNTADIVTWSGSRYTVQTVDDWSQWGLGYIKALATLVDLT